MAVVSLQSSNVFSYTFSAQGNTHFHHLYASNNNPVLNIGGQSWTIECWVKPVGRATGGGGSNYQSIFSKRLGATATSAYQGYLDITTGFLAYYNGTGYVSGVRPTPNTWNHLAWVFNQGANLRMFLNGTNVFTTTAVTTTANIDSSFHIGFNPGLASQYFGDISNFRIISGQAIYSGNFDISTFPVQLPNNDIGYHAGSTNVASTLTGNVILLTCNDQIIKSNGNTVINSFVSFGFVQPHVVETTELQNFSYYFPGNTGQSQNGTVLVTNVTNSLNLNTDFTIETWYYPTSNTGVLLERGYAGIGNNNASYILIWDSPNNNLNFAIANANNAAYSVGSLTGPAGSLGSPVINSWNHIAVTRAGNNYRGFLNGSLNYESGTNANVPYPALGRGLTIGGMFNSGQTYAQGIPANTISGYISNLRIIRGNSVYNAAFTPATTQLLVNTNTILLTAITPTLLDLSENHVINSNGMSEVTFSTNSPFTANAVANANSTSFILVNTASGSDLSRIYNKIDYQYFGQVIAIPQILGQRQSRIYNKIDYQYFGQVIGITQTLGQRQSRIYDRITEFSLPVPIFNTVGQDQSRIFAKFTAPFEFAYIPVGGAGGGGPTGNIEYQFWS